MQMLSTILTALIGALHLYILVLEMFLWTTPRGRKIFGTSVEQAKSSAALAANQGLYNGFLALGLFWGAFHPSPSLGFQLKLFFLGCVFVAGLYGAYSVSKRILFVQSVPALLALVATCLQGLSS